MKEWVGNRCLSRGDGANGAGKRASGLRLSASEAEHEDGASALGVPAAWGLRLWVIWVPDYMGLG